MDNRAIADIYHVKRVKLIFVLRVDARVAIFQYVYCTIRRIVVSSHNCMKTKWDFVEVIVFLMSTGLLKLFRPSP